ncbi:hypothetical protein LTR97_011168 [Elasticomyces elasticus]|uniref:Uncharacterized protein n=1 Tax=Elasticomyces elasticus TaxID=574655 RepID=A0AAN7VLN7_9PEZI|nr:hypothetical protein LTR97_011168 [Elasticomyces elasticus]
MHGVSVDPSRLEQPAYDVEAPLLKVAKQMSGRLTYISCNATSEQSVAETFARIEQDARHPIRGLVTLAGISGRSPAVDYERSAFQRIMDVNVTGTFLCAQAAARLMHKQMVAGSVVMFASMSATNVNKGVDTCAYNTSKSAVLQLARNLGAEWGNDGIHPPIRVNTISPGYIETPITMPTVNAIPGLRDLWEGGNMLGRLSTVHEHQASVLFLLADGSSYMTASDLRADAGHCAW